MMKGLKLWQKAGLVTAIVAGLTLGRLTPKQSFQRLESRLYAFSMLNPSTLVTYTRNYEPSLEERIVDYVKRKSSLGKDFLIEKVKQHDIVILGEIHFALKPVLREEFFMKEILPDLKKVGLKYLAVEMSENYKPHIEKYLKTGVKDKDFAYLESLYISNWKTEKVLNAWLDMVKIALDNDIKVIYIDIPDNLRNEDFSYREEYMTNKVREVLKNDKGAKMFIHIGALHAVEEDWTLHTQLDLGVDSPESLSKKLNKEFDCYSVISEPYFDKLPKELYETKEIIGFDIDEGPVSELRGNICYKKYGSAFDGAIIFPYEYGQEPES